MSKIAPPSASVAASSIPWLSAAIYTQTTDVERELNGLWTYDRKVFKMDKTKVRAANLAAIEN